jgi:hypothetical protein
LDHLSLMGAIIVILLILITLYIGKILTLLFPSLIYRGKNVYLPDVTFKARATNAALFPIALFQLLPAFKKYDIQDLKKIASKRTKIQDFGTNHFEPYFQLVINLIHNASFSYIGKFIGHDYLTRRLVARLRTLDLLRRKPEIENIEVKAPFFIIGLPRTGTTFLYRMLCTDTNSRFPKTWEFYDPVPRYPDDLKRDAKARSKFIGAAISKILDIVPQLQYQHELGADEPEECLLSLGMEMPIVPSTLFLLTRVHESLDWDLTEAYELHKKVLQILTYYSEGNPKRWVLKCPIHLGFVHEIEAVFPDSRLIWNHRDPNESIASLISLFRTFMEMHWEGPIELHKFGRDVLDFWTSTLHKADEAIQVTKCQVYHVKYNDLIKNPAETVQAIYKKFGLDYTPEHNDLLQKYIIAKNEERERIKKGQALHSYTLQEFGLTTEIIEEKLGWYLDKYLRN